MFGGGVAGPWLVDWLLRASEGEWILALVMI